MDLKFYLSVEDNKIIMASQSVSGGDIIDVEVTEDIYNNWINDNDMFIYKNGKIIENPDYENIKRQKERLRLDSLTLTPADVERALYKAKNMDFDDLKALIAQALPQVDIKGLSIEFRAKDFYRGAMAGGLRLFDVVGQLLGYSSADMDYLFEHKELPNGESSSVDVIQTS